MSASESVHWLGTDRPSVQPVPASALPRVALLTIHQISILLFCLLACSSSRSGCDWSLPGLINGVDLVARTFGTTASKHTQIARHWSEGAPENGLRNAGGLVCCLIEIACWVASLGFNSNANMIFFSFPSCFADLSMREQWKSG